jgi:peptidylprolyl isomerase
MATAKQGSRVIVNYVGKLEDGTVFDSSETNAPLEFVVGGGNVLEDFEQAIVGMSAGESKSIHIPSERAYGPYIKERVFTFSRSRAPENFNPEIGQKIQMYRADGLPVPVTVVGKTETSFIMDGNHPLAGKNLIFDVMLVEIL